MFKCIVDDEVELRQLAPRHAPALYSLVDANRSYLRKWLPWLDSNREVQDTRRFINLSRRTFAENKGIGTGIWYSEMLVGVVGLIDIDSPGGAASIGYWISEEYQGRGIVTRAVRALLDYAFQDLDLHRVEIRCASGNTGSQGIPDRLGFKKEGTLRAAERLYDRYRRFRGLWDSANRTEWLKAKKND